MTLLAAVAVGALLVAGVDGAASAVALVLLMVFQSVDLALRARPRKLSAAEARPPAR